ncbi:MAG: hypothetical protein M3P95_06155 [Actinomycetota bacterium]|nr:hypothetical protein [Actinomycetota bacterium]
MRTSDSSESTGMTPAAAETPDDALQQEIADEVSGGGAGEVKGSVDPPVEGAGDGLQESR